jgi:hypothetical protein
MTAMEHAADHPTQAVMCCHLVRQIGRKVLKARRKVLTF